ncbi:hypothetical protein D6D19_07065 [Aureobasidium pullulans]|uniref:Response regulatory domain-containing protein n=1 Tax=Aureobasidium pullulans TaxID=5580 RepID=A0A4S8ZZ34_AURPU|nr:hypothetical protein D6D19_07065 [Aureobasidium pullulans]
MSNSIGRRLKAVWKSLGIDFEVASIAISSMMLATWSGLQARFHTDPQGLHSYNSSQSAITGVWLFFNIMFSNSIQARYPALLIPTILYNIFVIVQLTSCSRFETWAQCWDLIYLTTKCYYTGIAISFVSGIIIYPVSCRTEMFKVQKKYLHGIRDVLEETRSYLANLQKAPTFSPVLTHGVKLDEPERMQAVRDGTAMIQKMAEVKAAYTKMRHELAMAKREIAWGKQRARDFTVISDLCRKVLMPLGGIAHMPEILKHIGSDGGWKPMFGIDNPVSSGSSATTHSSKHDQDDSEAVWRRSIDALIEPVNSMVEAIRNGIEHTTIQLELVTKTPKADDKAKVDTEAEGGKVRPSDANFSRHLEEMLNEFSAGRIEALNAWANSKGLSPDQMEELQSCASRDFGQDPDSARVPIDRQQLFLILYIQHMLYTTGIAVLELSKFSDRLVAEGVMSRNRLIVPSFSRVRRWTLSIWDTADQALADDDRPSSREEKDMLYGTSGRSTDDIDHLPPTNAFERFGVKIRRFQQFLKGPELGFGFRSGCATMSCAILAYLHQTQFIFTHYRLIWPVIIAAIGANMSAGQSGVSYMLRISGSFAALIICYLVWYIPNGHVAGVIVFMWFFSFLQMYFLIKWPKYIIGWLVILITEVLSIGYELQVAKIGVVAAATSTGVYFYPAFDVAAMRVACVLWGTVVSIFWTYLPYPITARGFLRRDMARIMHLLANYHAVVHVTIKTRLRGAEGDLNDKASRGHVLSNTRRAMFNKIMVLAATAKHNVYLQKYEPSLGGRFPIAMFEDILSQLTVLLDYMSLLSYSTEVWSIDGPTNHYFHHSQRSRRWLQDLAELILPIEPTEQRVTLILSQLSSALDTGRPLPAKTQSMEPFLLSQKLKELDPDILHMRHMLELGYSTYAVTEIISNSATSERSLYEASSYDFDTPLTTPSKAPGLPFTTRLREDFVFESHGRRYLLPFLQLNSSRSIDLKPLLPENLDYPPPSTSITMIMPDRMEIDTTISQPEPLIDATEEMTIEDRAEQHLLLVDDNVINLKLLSTFIKNLNLPAKTAVDGAKYKATSATSAFTTILMHISMPKMNGFKSSRAICELEVENSLPRAQIIALTALSSKEVTTIES